MRDPEVGIELHHVVHGQQKFVHERPVAVGDRLSATLTVSGLRQIAGTDIIAPQRDHRRRARSCARPRRRSSTRRVRDLTAHDLSPTTYAVTRAAGRLRRGQRRPQPDPPGPRGRPQRRPRRRDRARHVHPRPAAARTSTSSSASPAGSSSSARKFTKPVVVPEGGTEVQVEGTWRDDARSPSGHLRR